MLDLVYSFKCFGFSKTYFTRPQWRSFIFFASMILVSTASHTRTWCCRENNFFLSSMKFYCNAKKNNYFLFSFFIIINHLKHTLLVWLVHHKVRSELFKDVHIGTQHTVTRSVWTGCLPCKWSPWTSRDRAKTEFSPCEIKVSPLKQTGRRNISRRSDCLVDLKTHWDDSSK